MMLITLYEQIVDNCQTKYKQLSIILFQQQINSFLYILST